MSDHSEKLEQPASTPGTRARRRLSSLTCCAGYTFTGPEKKPLTVSICPAFIRTHWRREDGSTEPDAWYVLEREEKDP